MTGDRMDEIWSYARWAVEEGYGRYGLTVYVHVTRDNPVTATILFRTELYTFSLTLALSDNLAGEYEEERIKAELSKALRKIAEARDSRKKS